MSAFKERLFANWHLMRIMWLGIGIMMIVGGIQGRDWAMGLFSVFFLYQAVMNKGCCGDLACDNRRVAHKKRTDRIDERTN